MKRPKRRDERLLGRGVKKEEGHDLDNEGDNGSKEGVDEVDGVGSADGEDIYGDNE